MLVVVLVVISCVASRSAVADADKSSAKPWVKICKVWIDWGWGYQ